MDLHWYEYIVIELFKLGVLSSCDMLNGLNPKAKPGFSNRQVRVGKYAPEQ